MVFGANIVLGFIKLLVPIFYKKKTTTKLSASKAEMKCGIKKFFLNGHLFQHLKTR